MLAVIRILFIALVMLTAFPFVILYCLTRPRHPDLVHQIGVLIAKCGRFVGIDVELRYLSVDIPDKAVWIANHQNSYDMFTLPFALRKGVVSIGKKSLAKIPFFGQIYWITGNILIDRDRRSKAADTIKQAAEAIDKRHLSVWMFPEGTRSYGRGLQAFKTGAFHLALQAKVPMLPICCSSTHGQVKLNRWNNGKVIVEVGKPIDVSQWKENLRAEIIQLHDTMEQRIYELTMEARGEAADYQEVHKKQVELNQATVGEQA
ncbi:1-acylglycerol-3-phosphate O-acyltransferase [Agarivorans aestuarii]|uniref:1-acyl-sn-glycerol-3-phosphate acyltransferase n=1 Tax=Agarivorans aestuarii TaxID=1563703 RepID=A0ABU7G2K8_9ALTE|nr:1-acylglycerol-3-phosphate O-acyltransferase [Agarivorans aestuarii]MEE1673561.1 1-acylglycerol-3-phosphate O-acyltransferase [Agarivorans aestuarii]